jgi:Phycobilisome Linker polypeptide
MAFVSLGATTFLGGGARASVPAACAVSPPHVGAPLLNTAPAMMAFTSIDAPETSVSLSENSVEAKANVLYAAYKHVFGNAYLMEEERAALAVAESDFLGNTLSVKELVRALAKSSAYRTRFFEKTSPYRYVELNCKHLLGRGPTGQAEVSEHVQRVVNEGFDADIDSFIDSAEYDARFGSDSVPRFIYLGQYTRNDDFNRLNVMRMHWDGCSTSTKHGSTAPSRSSSSDLLMGEGEYVTGWNKVLKGLPAGFRPSPSGPKAPSVFPANPRAPVRIRIEVAPGCVQVIEYPGIVEAIEPAFKKQVAATNPGRKWNGVFF